MCSPVFTVFCPEFSLQFPLLQVFVPHICSRSWLHCQHQWSSGESWNKMKQTSWEHVADWFERRFWEERGRAKWIVCLRSINSNRVDTSLLLMRFGWSSFGALVHIFGELLRLPFPHRDVFLYIIIGLLSLALKIKGCKKTSDDWTTGCETCRWDLRPSFPCFHEPKLWDCRRFIED